MRSRATHSTGMVLDRALTREVLDIGLRIAAQHRDDPSARRLLTVALREVTSEQEAEGKTKKCVSRVWVAPPPAAQPMIRWAVEHQHLDPDRTVVHLGALLATFPFAGVVCRIAGRQLALDGRVAPRRVRDEARAELGDRSTIDVGARKVVTTLRHLGLLSGPDGGPLVLPASVPVVPQELTIWLTHALLLTRQVHAIDINDGQRAPELAWLAVGLTDANGYPLLERHSEANRIVAVEAAAG